MRRGGREKPRLEVAKRTHPACRQASDFGGASEDTGLEFVIRLVKIPVHGCGNCLGPICHTLHTQDKLLGARVSNCIYIHLGPLPEANSCTGYQHTGSTQLSTVLVYVHSYIFSTRDRKQFVPRPNCGGDRKVVFPFVLSWFPATTRFAPH